MREFDGGLVERWFDGLDSFLRRAGAEPAELSAVEAGRQALSWSSTRTEPRVLVGPFANPRVPRWTADRPPSGPRSAFESYLTAFAAGVAQAKLAADHDESPGAVMLVVGLRAGAIALAAEVGAGLHLVGGGGGRRGGGSGSARTAWSAWESAEPLLLAGADIYAVANAALSGATRGVLSPVQGLRPGRDDRVQLLIGALLRCLVEALVSVTELPGEESPGVGRQSALDDRLVDEWNGRLEFLWSADDDEDVRVELEAWTAILRTAIDGRPLPPAPGSALGRYLFAVANGLAVARADPGANDSLAMATGLLAGSELLARQSGGTSEAQSAEAAASVAADLAADGRDLGELLAVAARAAGRAAGRTDGGPTRVAQVLGALCDDN